MPQYGAISKAIMYIGLIIYVILNLTFTTALIIEFTRHAIQEIKQEVEQWKKF